MDQFEVILAYREPTYDLAHGTDRGPFEAHYIVEAPSEHDAIDTARSAFEEAFLQSSVSWMREIVSVYCAPVIEA